MPILASRAAAALKAFGHSLSSGVSVIRDSLFNMAGLLLKGNTGDPLDTVVELPPPISYENSGNSVVVATNGTARPSKRSPYRGQYYSNYFNGTTDYLTVAQTFQLATATTPFTIEAWVYINSYTGLAIAATNWASSGAIPFFFGLVNTSASGSDIGGKPCLNYYNGSAWATGVISSTTIPLGTWAHVAGVFDGTNAKIYVNGILSGTWAAGAWQTTGQVNFHIGRRWDTATGAYYNGYISNFRLVIGTAVYTSNFIPSTSPITAITNTTYLTSQSSTFIDNSSNNYAITVNGTPSISQFIPMVAPSTYDYYGSLYTSGTSPGSLSAPNSVANFGANNFTAEAWVYFTTNSAGYQPIFGNAGTGDAAGGWIVITETNNNLYFYYSVSSGSWAGSIASGVTPKINVWMHIAVVRNGTTVTLYLNGSSIGTLAVSTNTILNPVNNAYIGYYPWFPGGARSFSGYISNVRFVNQSAVYTTTFTPPALPLTAVTGTTLLTAQYNGQNANNQHLDRSNFSADLTRLGDVKQGTFSPYVYNGSTGLGGSNWLSTPSNTALNFGTNDFTVECWVYITAFNNGFTTWVMYDGGSTSARFTLNVGATGADTDSGYGLALSKTTVTPATVSLNTWTHIAVVRQGSTFNWFTNGVKNLTATSSGSFVPASVTTTLGNYSSSYSTGTGYISNMRIVNGTAVYTSNFTPSVVPLTPINKTQLLMFGDLTLIDRSVNRLAFTYNGTPTVSSFGPFAPAALTQTSGNFSSFFNGSTDFYTIAANTVLNFGTGDFTVECWVYMPTTIAGTNGKQILDFRPDSTNGAYFTLGSSITGVVGTYVNSVSQISHQTLIQPGQWYHIAVARQSSVTRLFINGTVSNTTPTDTTNYTTSGTIKIGTNAFRASATDTYWYGYISNVRIINGTALYTTGFTAPTTAPERVTNTVLLGLATSSGEDLSYNSLPIVQNGSVYVSHYNPFATSGYVVTPGALTTPIQTGGSMYFDGTGDYLTAPHNTTYDLSTASGKWSIECWVYLTGATTGYRTFISKRATGTQWEIGVNPTNSYLYFYNGTVYLTNIGIRNSIWQHCAAVYDGTTLRMYVNGVQGYSGAINAVAGTDLVVIGAISGATQPVTGYIADLRVVRGRISYTGGFIPPSSPLPTTPEAVLQIRGGMDSGIFDNTGCNDIQTINGAKVSTAIKKFNSGSIQLNSATSDYLFINGNPIFNTGTTDWTVEAWVYLNSMPTSDAWPTAYSSHMVLMGTGSPTLGDGVDCIIGQTKLLIQINDTQYASTSTHGMSINTWYHLAYVRSSGAFVFYVNGTNLGSVAVSVANGTGSGTYIGCETGEGAFLNGYIDDLRFSRFARYTSPFFPVPTVSFAEAGPSATDPGTTGLPFVAGDGLSAATAGISAAAIKAQTGTNADGAYWINLPTVGPTQVYCLMNSAASGGGWMMAMKATRGTTFSYSSTHWNTVTTLNPTANNRSDGDAKFNTMNYFQATDIMALFPDIATNGGSLGTNPYTCWSWLESNFNGSATTLINFFNTAGTYNTGTVNTSSNYGGKFIKDAKLFSGWASGIFSSQADIRFYGFNFKNGGLSYGGAGSCRWGFGWNENGEGLYASPATMATGGATGSNDVWGGIGMDSNGGSYSAGDLVSCCQDTTGINRSARVEIYIR